MYVLPNPKLIQLWYCPFLLITVHLYSETINRELAYCMLRLFTSQLQLVLTLPNHRVKLKKLINLSTHRGTSCLKELTANLPMLRINKSRRNDYLRSHLGFIRCQQLMSRWKFTYSTNRWNQCIDGFNKLTHK